MVSHDLYIMYHTHVDWHPEDTVYTPSRHHSAGSSLQLSRFSQNHQVKPRRTVVMRRRTQNASGTPRRTSWATCLSLHICMSCTQHNTKYVNLKLSVTMAGYCKDGFNWCYCSWIKLQSALKTNIQIISWPFVYLCYTFWQNKYNNQNGNLWTTIEFLWSTDQILQHQLHLTNTV